MTGYLHSYRTLHTQKLPPERRHCSRTTSERQAVRWATAGTKTRIPMSMVKGNAGIRDISVSVIPGCIRYLKSPRTSMTGRQSSIPGTVSEREAYTRTHSEGCCSTDLMRKAVSRFPFRLISVLEDGSGKLSRRFRTRSETTCSTSPRG